MARVKRYIDTDVLTEARNRLHHTMDTFDDWIVSFSGGKDSLACVMLTRSVMQERGDLRPVKAVFRDEELIPDGVIDFLATLREEPWLDLQWWAVPMDSQKFILGQTYPLITFDPSREWVRQPPPYALGPSDLGMGVGEVLDQNEGDELLTRNMKGRIAIITGVRASESMMRYRSCVNKLHENYIVASQSRRASLVRPIFDWQEDDVFRYFYDEQIAYCPVYDFQAWAGERMRVSTPLHAEAAKRLHALATHAPELWDGLMRVFPEVASQARYWGELDRGTTVMAAAASWEAVAQWIDENIEDPNWHRKAHAELIAVRTRADRVPESYPLPHVLRELMRSSGKRTIQPMRPDDGRKMLAKWKEDHGRPD